MADKKKSSKLPPGASEHLVGSGKKARDAEKVVDRIAEKLAEAEWQSCKSRPKGDPCGYFVVLHWYNKEKVWVPIYMQHGNISSQLSRLFSGRADTPISKYLSSFPHSQRKRLWVKWLFDSSVEQEDGVKFEDVLEAFSDMYNRGEVPAFNVIEKEEKTEHFSLLDY